MVRDRTSKFINRIKKKISENLILIALYLIFTIILTYPVAFRIRTHIAGGGDAWQVLWSFWYTKMAVLSPTLSLNYTNYIFYPDGVPLIPFGTAFNQLLSIPLQHFFGFVITYNLLWLLSFVLGGYGTFHLVKYLTNDKNASFIAGIIFAFSPYHYAHALGHMGATTIEWIPFCALYLMKMIREKDLKNSIYAAVFFILVAMSDLQFIVYMGLFVGVLLVYEVLYELKVNGDSCTIFERITSLKSLFVKYLLFAIVSFAGVLPFTYDMIKTAISSNNFLEPSISDNVRYSADIVGFFTPSALHPLFGNWLATHVYRFFTGNTAEHTTYIGYTVMILSLYAITALRKNKQVKFWGISTIFFILMSLGPVLHIFGKTQFTIFNVTIPLPYILIYYLVPFVNNGRTLGRFDVVVMLSFAVLAGYGITEFINRFDSKQKKAMFSCVISCLVIFEFLTIPVLVSPVDVPEFYDQISKDNEKYALLEIPATTVYGCGIMSEYYQTIHGKPTVNGQVARTPTDAWDFQINTPLVRQLTYYDKYSGDILNQNISEVGESVLNYYNIRYVILHTRYMNLKQLDFENDLLQSTLKEKPQVYGDDGFIIYPVTKADVKTFMLIGDGWNVNEKWPDGPGRWMNGNASIKIISHKDVNATFHCEVGSFYKKRDLNIYFNEELIGTYNIELKKWPDNTPRNISQYLPLKKGENIIRFYSPDKGTVPSKVGAWDDRRELSLAFQNMTLVNS